ncbi:Acetyltransferase involved in cellulose biosynthesis, CelD/BcsL family [Pseudomonas sp. ok272]|uniref:GNAT family N-acetyltransferase n=1 Tax=unclassified Pseudomonas TaxID=196821 RepID=UPI0008CF7299|nr:MULTISPECIES: GNAT family N-acetyltransferase [unclassified Pseudomonas]SEM53105.1 Acetyltransferase involved in cellulose biosynthesis, CelD/BcsL family [Pseudomonas sp. ok272]SFM24975.1 Acetyltransferase involved in cellulose biosynthesis, CelD/BcsL family [Pseudomonas sp. ok602]
MSTPALRWAWCTSLDSEDVAPLDYEALCQRIPEATPFNNLAWLRAAEHALPSDTTLHVLLGWQGEHLCLCLPLICRRERFAGLPFTVVRHLGYPLADRIALLASLDDQHARQALGVIRRRLPHALLQLNELATPRDRQPALTAWLPLSSTFEHRISCRVPVHRISEDDRQEVSGDPRYKLRRARKRIAACGAQVRRLTPDASNMGPILEAIAEVEAVSWKGDEGVGIFSEARHRHWMSEAFTALAAQGQVRVVLLELAGRCISYRLGLLAQGRLYDYNLAFLPQYADLGSGRVLLDEWIRWGLDDGWLWIDASRVSLDNSSHQLHERMTGQREHWRWSFYSWRPSGICLGLGLRLWQHLKPRLNAWRARHRPANAPAMEHEHASPPHRQR